MYQILSESVRFYKLYINKHFGVFSVHSVVAWETTICPQRDSVHKWSQRLLHDSRPHSAPFYLRQFFFWAVLPAVHTSGTDVALN